MRVRVRDQRQIMLNPVTIGSLRVDGDDVFGESTHVEPDGKEIRERSLDQEKQSRSRTRTRTTTCTSTRTSTRTRTSAADYEDTP